MAGKNEQINGTLSLTDKYQLTNGEDILEISGADISFLDPAGEIFLDQGNDTVTITDSTITNNTGTGATLAFYLGSGDDSLTIDNSTLNAQMLAGSGNDCITVTGSPVTITQKLSLGTGNDTLTLKSTLLGSGNIDFGDGEDTLIFDGGSLKTSGAISSINQLIVTSSGGTLGQDFTLIGESANVLLSGNLYKDGRKRNISFSNGFMTLTTDDGINTNVGYILDNAIVDHAWGGGINFVNANDGAIQANSAIVSLHDVNVTGTGMSGQNTYWKIDSGSFSDGYFAVAESGGRIEISDVYIQNMRKGGLIITDTQLVGNNISFSRNYDSQHSYSGGAIIQNGGSAILSSAVFNDNYVYGSNRNAEGGAIFTQNDGDICILDTIFSSNHTSSFANKNTTFAYGGAIVQHGGKINISNTKFFENLVEIWGVGYEAKAYAYGGAIAVLGGSADLTEVFFSANGFGLGGTTGQTTGQGGAIYASSATINMTDAKFEDNFTWNNGGALFLDKSTLNYSVSENSVIVNKNNWAWGNSTGGFLWLQNAQATFDVSGTLIIGDGDVTIIDSDEPQHLDSLAGNREAFIRKTGRGTWIINSYIDDKIQWNVVTGILKLESLARVIRLDNWTINVDAELHLSALDDTINIGAGKTLAGIINFGGGNDTINTNGYIFSGGKLLFNALTVTGDGKIDSTLAIRDDDEGMSLTLDGVTIDSDIIGGRNADMVSVTRSSTLNGKIALAGGRNYLSTLTNLTINDGFILDEAGETHLVVYNGASLAKNEVNLYSDSEDQTLSVSMDWSDVPDLDKVRLVVSSDSTFETFEFTVELYNQTKAFTINMPENYFIQFQAQDEDGWAQRLLPDEIAPDQVTGIELSVGGITWTATHDNLGGNGVKQYKVEIASDGAFSNIVESAVVTGNQYVPQMMLDGIYYVRVRAEDCTGNLGEWSNTVTGAIDNIPPTKPTVMADVTAPTNQNVTITATFSADSAQKQYSLDGNTWSAYNASVVLEENGTVYFRGIDAVGNVSEVAEYAVTNIDKIAPVITLTGDTATPTQSAVLSASVDDSVTIYYSTDNENWNAYTEPLAVTANGTYYFKATDAVGNMGANSISFGNIDIIPPNKPIISADVTAPTNGDVNLTAVFSDDSTEKQYSTDGNTWSDYTTGIVMTDNGTVYFRGVDAVGNISDVASYEVTNIDKVAPTKPTAAADVMTPTNHDVTVTAIFSDDSVQKQYSLDNLTWLTYTIGVVMNENGSVYFRAIDEAGNISDVAGYEVSNIYNVPDRSVFDDLNGDGRADIVMSIIENGHEAYGATGAWLIQGDTPAVWGNLSTRSVGWDIFAMGETTANKGTADIYVKSTDNVVGAWVTDVSGKVSGWQTVGEFDADTEVLGLGDFNGDGQTDLLLRNTNGAVGCYLTDGTGWNYFQSLGDEWSICAVGDLNGDGRDDVVLKHDAGFAGSWLTQSDYTMKWANLDTLPEGYSIVGTGDFNGDGTDDVLLKNGNYYGAWIVQDGNAKSWMGLGDLGNVTVEQIGDFDADGIDDLRIRTAAGDLGAQLVKGADTLDWKYYGSVGSEWSTGLAAI